MTQENTVQNPYAKIEGTLLYVSIQEASKAYQKPGTDPKPDEWKASVVLTDEDYVDDLESWATKNDIKLSLKKVKAVEFEEKYKTTVPEGAGKNVWVLTLRKSTELGKTGKPVPLQFKPKVYQRKGNTLVDVTNSVLVGNGSKGIVSTDLFVRNNGSCSIYLKNVLVTDLIEYVKGESGSDYIEGSEFGIPVADTPEPTPKPSANKPAGKPKAPPVDESDDSDAPF